MRQSGWAWEYGLSLLRGLWYRFKYQTILGRARFGRRFRVDGRLVIKGPGKVVFGDKVLCVFTVTPFTHAPEARITVGDYTILAGTRFGAAQSIEVGAGCIICDTRIMDTDFHHLGRNRRSKDAPPAKVRPVRIGNNVWLTWTTAVLKGVTIGDNSIVGINSVVTRDVPPDTIVAGNPAREVKKIPD